MDRKRVGIASIVIVSILVLGVVIVALSPKPIEGFEWVLEVDDTFQFEVRTIGMTYGGLYSSEYIHMLNETDIEATIQALPSLDNILGAQSFMQDVALYRKVSCSFANGSPILPDVEEILCEGISGCILPIGNWEIIGSMFPNREPTYEPSTEEMMSVLYEEYLYLMYWWYGDYDDSGGWWGDSSLANGRPLNVLWQYTHQSTTIFIELTLIE